MTPREWVVEFHPECEKWADGLEQADAEALLAAIRILRDQGPALGRPLVDVVESSRHANMKELRPGSTGRTEIRVLFAFDLRRQAILLLGGDKSGRWSGWYEANVPIADQRFSEHQAALAVQRRLRAGRAGGRAPGSSGRGRR
ncbi:type II toxin-antitoxin system RelE/ParE family toxin [Dactylosporangium sp. CA-233914]|uniref:type II toxin-antitoxin system RelE/ParE family toxin n=1 Tax=Dactylosporangium sp. CA-233914 TaxID=3239934 RepID=UPI003D8A6222